MAYSQYRFKFYINTTHAIYIAGKLGQVHPHTWEIELNTMKMDEGFISFTQFEKRIEQLLAPYSNVYLNDVPPFTTLNPTLENLTRYFKDFLHQEMYKIGWILISIEVAETPTRSFIIDLTDKQEGVRNNTVDIPNVIETIDSAASQRIQKMMDGLEEKDNVEERDNV